MTTTVSILIKAQNLAGSVLQSVTNQFQTLQNQANKLGATVGVSINGAFKNLKTTSDEFSKRGITVYDLFNDKLLLIAGSAALAGAALAKIGGDSINKAISREMETLGSVNTAIQLLGMSEKQGTKFVKDFNQSVAELGKTLPTSAENISTISRVIIGDYSKALKSAGASNDQIKSSLLGASSRLALLGDQANLDIGTSRSAISGYLAGGTGIKGLNQYEFFGKNQMLTDSLKELLEKQFSGKDLTDLTKFQRIKLLNQALDKALPQDAIDRLQGTSKAKISAFMDMLFDPEIGMFSITKDLDAKKDGYQSVYTSFQTTLDLIIGDGGILSQLGRLSGLKSTAPLTILKTGVDTLNSYMFGFNRMLQSLPQLDFGGAGFATGKFLAEVTNIVTSGILGALASVDYGGLLKATVMGIGGFLSNLDWKVYAVGAGALLAASLLPIVTGALVVLGGAIVAALAGVPVLLVAAVGLSVAALIALIKDNSTSVAASMVEGYNYLKDGTKRMFMAAAGGLQSIVNAAGDLINTVIAPISQFIGNLGAKIGGLINSTGDTISTGVAAVQTAPSTAGNFLSSAISSVGSFVSGLFTGSRYAGQIPGDFMRYVQEENRNKPAGSSLVIANSSELILPANQVKNLFGSTNQRGNAKNVTLNFASGAFNFHVPGVNAVAIAEEVMDIIANSLQAEMEDNLGY